MLPDRHQLLLTRLRGRRADRPPAPPGRSAAAAVQARPPSAATAAGRRRRSAPAAPAGPSSRAVRQYPPDHRRSGADTWTPVQTREGASIWPAWTGVAAAAAVLLVLGAGSYLYFASALPFNQAVRWPTAYKPNVNKDNGQTEPPTDGPGPENPTWSRGPTTRTSTTDPPDRGAPGSAGERSLRRPSAGSMPVPPEADPELNPAKDPPGPVFTDRGMETFELRWPRPARWSFCPCWTWRTMPRARRS